MCLKLFCNIQNRRKFVLREQCSFDHGSNHMFTIYTQKKMHFTNKSQNIFLFVFF